MAERAFIGLGSNVGDHYANCTRGIREVLGDSRATLKAVSSLYYTSPLSTIPQPDILNGVFAVDWKGSAVELLWALKQIEVRMGRLRGPRNGPRIIDLDILLFDDAVIRAPDLIVPHPRLHKRKFALIPCLEIAPSLIHPVLKKPLHDLLEAIQGKQTIHRFCTIREEDIVPGAPGPADVLASHRRTKVS